MTKIPSKSLEWSKYPDITKITKIPLKHQNDQKKKTQNILNDQNNPKTSKMTNIPLKLLE